MPNSGDYLDNDEVRHEAESLARDALRSTAKRWYANPLWIWAFQCLIGSACALMVGYMVLWMDTHNDGRYVLRKDYDRDNSVFLERYHDNRATDKSDRESIRLETAKSQGDVNKRLDRFDVQLDTIGNDIKLLLRNQITK